MDHLELMRDPARTFPSVADPDAVRQATIWHCRYASLAPLAGLRHLERLVIATFPDASLEFLGRLEQLRHLRIMHMPKVSDIEPLAGLTQLTSLSLSTLPSWDASGKTTTVRSLEPLAALPALAHLELLGICPPDKSLVPLEQCPHLRTARFSHYPAAEVERFFRQTAVADQFNPV
ncbi:hypothetical protein NX786_03285 [Telluria mixta]|uniref:Leucine-rich repeat domain-containing protein n=1 Tax=Telluria mixta TaxID=34071 RepID=A0ABT2BTA8_9BURK|nr:hypothetical protein [Telluria mixta]MCS0628353.1 hypothetical protein [Telluria mixta]WEM93539.1 hypothetical protein P0M04_18710 [Telluria mixta]